MNKAGAGIQAIAHVTTVTNPPKPPQQVEAYALGGFLSGPLPVDYVIERFLQRLEKSRVCLQPREVVHHDCIHMGFLTVSVH